ncbi:MAG: hypothetical protein H6716_29700, partial [Polyangiaceae bacterium]|nr:hypothetical protein [Polyangiaceae bacterium]
MILFLLVSCLTEAPPATVEVVVAQRALWPGIPIDESDVALGPILAERAEQMEVLTDLEDAVGRRPTQRVDEGDVVKPGLLLVEQPGEAPGAVLSSADLTTLFIPCLGEHPVTLGVSPSCPECVLVVESSSVHVLEAGEVVTLMVGDSMNTLCAWHAITRQEVSTYPSGASVSRYAPRDFLVDPMSIDVVRLAAYGLYFGEVSMELSSPQSNCWQLEQPGHPPIVNIPVEVTPHPARSYGYDKRNMYPTLKLDRGEGGLVGLSPDEPLPEVDATCPSLGDAAVYWGTLRYFLAARGR